MRTSWRVSTQQLLRLHAFHARQLTILVSPVQQNNLLSGKSQRRAVIAHRRVDHAAPLNCRISQPLKALDQHHSRVVVRLTLTPVRWVWRDDELHNQDDEAREVAQRCNDARVYMHVHLA
jgi:hypothetical protein